MSVCVQNRGNKTASHWHHRSVNKTHTWFGQADVSNSGALLRQKAASACLPPVRPDMPHLASVQIPDDVVLHLRLFYTASREIHRFVNIEDVGKCYPALTSGTRSPAGCRSNQLIRDWYRRSLTIWQDRKQQHTLSHRPGLKSIDAAHKCVFPIHIKIKRQ